MTDYCYFILPDVVSTDRNNLSAGERIFAIPTHWPMGTHIASSEGPFFNLKYLMENSKIYHELKKRNPKRAHKIVQKEYVVKVREGLITEPDLTYSSDFLDAIQHLIQGDVKNEKVTGIHFYNEKRVKVLELHETNSFGVWSATIERLDKKTGKWIKKDRPTTFFPKDWSVMQMLSEITNAEKNKNLKPGFENIYQAKTTSGIPVEIVYMNGKMKTIYPIL